VEVDVSSFYELPRRIFLDSSTLQTLQDYGSFIWDSEALPESARIRRDPWGLDKLEALRAIMFVNQRAMFEFALSENSLAEVSDKGDTYYLGWAYDVLDYWLICIEEYGGLAPANEPLLAKLDSGSFGYLGVKDRLLLKDAIFFGCEAFLTMENRLPKNAAHMERELSIKVVTPVQYWELLRPWAKLYV
jgi:hypothetical protein